MKSTVRIMFPKPDGGTADICYEIEAPTTADAICMGIDKLEADGIPVGAITSFAIVAKSGVGAAGLLPAQHQEPQPCAA